MMGSGCEPASGSVASVHGTPRDFPASLCMFTVWLGLAGCPSPVVVRYAHGPDGGPTMSHVIGRCENCRHWGRPDDLYGFKEGVLPDWSKWNQLPPELKDAYEQHNRESRQCSKVDEGWMWEGTVEELPLATVWDGSEYKASLHTHKSFGCVLWESV